MPIEAAMRTRSPANATKKIPAGLRWWVADVWLLPMMARICVGFTDESEAASLPEIFEALE